MKKSMIFLVVGFFLLGGIGGWTPLSPAPALGEVTETDEGGDGVLDENDHCLAPESILPFEIEDCISGIESIVEKEFVCELLKPLEECAKSAKNHGDFVSCVSHFTNELKMDDIISGAEKGAIQSCAANSDIGIPDCEECPDGEQQMTKNRHRSRFRVADETLEVPCLQLSARQYYALELKLHAANALNLHFKLRKAEPMADSEVPQTLEEDESCGNFDLETNTLTLPVELGEQGFNLEMQLMSVQANNLHFKLKGMKQAD